ncbi:hypothetical protein [Cupriavidus gilardii]|uniref:Uncharacterized protein n=1 Tax=Cupriavidus gilardii TaxID=82541 RepID=A0ABY4VRK4_9BURK|nr:hypothetical protein [Cupriavidus gilardii]USE78912.1 hypothetical protein NDR89_19955 [Cupriavidus gilardii]UXC37187.1 hypothetical protein N4G38_07000 [Cupriavidus gilardii]
MNDSIKVKTLKGFNNLGGYVGRNREITVTEHRARDLERNGLVTREVQKTAEPQTKAAPVPANKKAAEPKNKDA